MSTKYTIDTTTKIKRVLVDEIEVIPTDPWTIIIVPTNTDTPTQEEVETWLTYTNVNNHFTFTFETAVQNTNWQTVNYYGSSPFPINNHCITIFKREAPFSFTVGGCAINEKGTVAQWSNSETNQVLGLRILHEMLHALGINSDAMITTDFIAFSQYLEYIRYPNYKQFKADKIEYENDPYFQSVYYEWLLDCNNITKYYTIENDNQNHTIHVDHYPNPTITYTLSNGATPTNVTGVQSVNWNTTRLCGFILNPGYKLKKVIINGRVLTDFSVLIPSGPYFNYYFYNIISDQTIHFEFIADSDFTVLHNVAFFDSFASFEVKTLEETITFASFCIPATIFTEYLYYTQEDVPLNTGFDEYGMYILATNINEKADIVISTHNELGEATLLFPSFSGISHFYTINNIVELEELIRYETILEYYDI